MNLDVDYEFFDKPTAILPNTKITGNYGVNTYSLDHRIGGPSYTDGWIAYNHKSIGSFYDPYTSI